MKGPSPSLREARWEQFIFLRNLSEYHAEKCIGRMTRKIYNKGEYIIRKGTIGTTTFFLDVGHAQAILDGTILTDLKSGSTFGEVAFVASCRKVLRIQGCKEELAVRVCDVVAVDTVHVLELSVRDFILVMEAHEYAELFSAMDDPNALASKNKINLQRVKSCDTGTKLDATNDANCRTKSEESATDTVDTAVRMPGSPDMLSFDSTSKASNTFGDVGTLKPLVRPNAHKDAPDLSRGYIKTHKDSFNEVSKAGTENCPENTQEIMAMYVHRHRLLRIHERSRQPLDEGESRRESIRHAITLLAAGWLQRHDDVVSGCRSEEGLITSVLEARAQARAARVRRGDTRRVLL